MSKDLSNKLGTGITPQTFMQGMTKNQEDFKGRYDEFQWENEENREFFQSLKYRDDIQCLILAADWCGDVVRNIPVVFRVMEEAEVPTEVLIMEENTDVMDQFLTMGGRAVPIVIFTDTGGFVLGQWGPRPRHVQKIMEAFKKENLDREAPDYQEKIKETRKEMQMAYGEGTGYQAVIAKELRDLMSGF